MWCYRRERWRGRNNANSTKSSRGLRRWSCTEDGRDTPFWCGNCSCPRRIPECKTRYNIIIIIIIYIPASFVRSCQISRRIKSLKHPDYRRAPRDVKHLYGVPRVPRRRARPPPTKDVRPTAPDYVREMREKRLRLQMKEVNSVYQQ